MLFARVFAVVVAAAATVVANDDDVTTLTSTTTKTLTVTQCNPTKTDCPHTKYYPAGNTTSYYPTATGHDVVKVTPTKSTPVDLPAATTSRAVTAGAGTVVAQSGLLIGAIGLAAAALL